MLVSLDVIPAGSSLEFVYRPPWSEVAAWVASALSLALILAWLVRPDAGGAALGVASGGLRRSRDQIGKRFGARWREEDG
jgi:hypothetical protein